MYGWHLYCWRGREFKLQKAEPLSPDLHRWEMSFYNLENIKAFLDKAKEQHPLETLTLEVLKENQ